METAQVAVEQEEQAGMRWVHLALETPMLGPGMVLGFADPGRREGSMAACSRQSLSGTRGSTKSPISGRKTDLPACPSQPAHRDS